MGNSPQERNDGLDHRDLAVVKFICLRRILRAVMLQFLQNAAPAQFHAHLDVGIEVMVAPDAADDVVTGEDRLQIIKWMRRIPRIRIGGIPRHPPEADQKEKASTHKRIQRVHIQRMLCKKPRKVLRPSRITVKMSIRIIRRDLELEIVRGDHASVVVLVQPPFLRHFLRGLLQLAFPKQRQALVIVECFRFRILIDKLDHVTYPAITFTPPDSAARISSDIRSLFSG